MNKKLRVKKSELSHFDESTKKGMCDFGTFFFFWPICLRGSYRIKSFEKCDTPSEFISQLSLWNKAQRHKSTKQGFCVCHKLTPLKLSYCFYKRNCSIANGQIEAGGVPLWTCSICRPLGVCSSGPVWFSLNTNQKARTHLFLQCSLFLLMHLQIKWNGLMDWGFDWFS